MITWKENIPKKEILGLRNFWIFSDVQNAVIFFYNLLFIKAVNYVLKKSRDFFKETFFFDVIIGVLLCRYIHSMKCQPMANASWQKIKT